MFVPRSVLASVLSSTLLVALLAGCNRAETPPAPKTDESSSGSVMSPPNTAPAPAPGSGIDNSGNTATPPAGEQK